MNASHWFNLLKRVLRSRGSEVQILSGTPAYLIENVQEIAEITQFRVPLKGVVKRSKTSICVAVDVGKMGNKPSSVPESVTAAFPVIGMRESRAKDHSTARARVRHSTKRPEFQEHPPP